MKLYYAKQNIIIAIVTLALLFLVLAFQWGWLSFISRASSESPSPALTPVYGPYELPASGENITRDYQWQFESRDWNLTFNISEGLYDYYQGIDRAPSPDYSIYVSHPEDDSCVEALAAKLELEAGEQWFDLEETLNFIASFVQDLKYEKEDAEYPKYPLETLVDCAGDCEDTSILMASLLQPMGYDVVLLYYAPAPTEDSGHMAVGVAAEGVSGHWKYEIDGKDYYYLETTEKLELGEIPTKYKGREPTIYKPLPIPLLKLTSCSWTAYGGIAPSDTLKLEATVTNWGTADAEGAYIYAFFTGEEHNAKQSEPFDLGFGYEISPITIKDISVPVGGGILWVQLFHNGIMDEESLLVEV